LSHLPFGDSTFHAVTANFVVNHVQDPRAAMRELARVTRPAGCIAVSIWPARTPEWAGLVAGAFSRAGVVPVPSQRLDVELDFDRSADGLLGLAEAAGLDVRTATELTWDSEVSVDALWSGIAGGVATVGQTFLAQTPAVQVSAEREFYEATERLADDGMLRLSSAAAYLVAA
jgi:SAM-dependent methyltransferase